MTDRPRPSMPNDTKPATTEERLRIAEERIQGLADAVRVLAGGLEPRPTLEPDLNDASRAACHARELMVATGF